MVEYPGLCDRSQDHIDFMGARVCDHCGWARQHHREAMVIREYPNARGRGMAVAGMKVIGYQLPLWQMWLVCVLTHAECRTEWA